MYSSSSPSHDHSFDQKPKTNNQSLQKTRYPSFSFVESSTANDVGKQNTQKKIIWKFSYSVPRNHNDVVKQKKHSCDVCNKVFTSNKALNGHMRCHGRQNGPTVAAPSSEKQQLCRRRRYMNIDDEDDDDVIAAAEILLSLSWRGYEDVNHRGSKRQKLACNMMEDDEKTKKKKEQGVMLTSGGHVTSDIDEKDPSNHDIEDKKKKINEGETELGSKLVKNFDLNELPSDGVVKNFDLDELPSDDVAKNFDLNELPSDDCVKNFDLNELPSNDFEDETN